jgi:hypothetical protein
MSPNRVFVSYSRADLEFVKSLANQLKNAGIDVWLDVHDIQPGKTWDLEVEKALNECRSIVFIASPTSVESQNVLDEVYSALDDGKVVLPVKIMECKLPLRLKRLQYIDLTENYDEKFQELVTALKTDNTDGGSAGSSSSAATTTNQSNPREARPAAVYPGPGSSLSSDRTQDKKSGGPLSKKVIIGIGAAVLIILAIIMLLPSSSGTDSSAPVEDNSSTTSSDDPNSNTGTLTPVEFSNHIDNISKNVMDLWSRWNEQFKTIADQTNYSSLRPYREDYQNMINGSLKSMQSMQDANNSQAALKKAMIDYLNFQSKISNTMQALEQLDESSTKDDRAAAIADYQKALDDESTYSDNLVQAHQAYARDNGITLSTN